MKNEFLTKIHSKNMNDDSCRYLKIYEKYKVEITKQVQELNERRLLSIYFLEFFVSENDREGRGKYIKRLGIRVPGGRYNVEDLGCIALHRCFNKFFRMEEYKNINDTNIDELIFKLMPDTEVRFIGESQENDIDILKTLVCYLYNENKKLKLKLNLS